MRTATLTTQPWFREITHYLIFRCIAVIIYTRVQSIFSGYSMTYHQLPTNASANIEKREAEHESLFVSFCEIRIPVAGGFSRTWSDPNNIYHRHHRHHIHHSRQSCVQQIHCCSKETNHTPAASRLSVTFSDENNSNANDMITSIT